MTSSSRTSTQARRVRNRAISTTYLRSRFPLKSNFPRSRSWRFHGTYLGSGGVKRALHQKPHAPPV